LQHQQVPEKMMGECVASVARKRTRLHVIELKILAKPFIAAIALMRVNQQGII
jgi:hypothetical protein